MIRVGRCKYNSFGKRTDPSFPEFTSIVVLMRSHSEYGCLGPYELKDANSRIMENSWQFSKIYERVPKTIQYYSRWDKTVIWDHPAETHYRNGQILPAYWTWREKGMNNPYYVRYPVGFSNMSSCLFALAEGSEERLDYISARKKIYIPIYCDLVKQQDKFLELKRRFKNGENLLIIEVDGPHEESLNYYMEEYGVKDDFIESGTMKATEENLMIMMEDDKHPFGHGYCLAMAIQEMEYLVDLV